MEERDAIATELAALIMQEPYSGYDIEIDTRSHYAEIFEDGGTFRGTTRGAEAWTNILVYSNMGDDEDALKDELLAIAERESEQTGFYVDVDYCQVYDAFPYHAWTIIVGD